MKLSWCLWALAAALAGAGPAWARSSAMSVQVREAPVRAAPSFLGAVVGSLAYGDRVDVLGVQGAWSQVASGDVSGWVHQSALTAKRIVLTAGREDARVAASGDELALAGKGFNSDIEARFKANNRNVDFAWIDWMEAVRIEPKDKLAFLAAGGLRPREGRAP